MCKIFSLQYLIFIFFVNILFGCVVDLGEEYPFDEKPVINAFLKHGDPIYLEITENYQVAPNFRNFYHGTLSLFENGILLENIRNVNNNFLFDVKAEQGNVYNIVFQSDSDREALVKAKTGCGNKFEIQKLTFTKVVKVNNGTINPLINLKIIDPPAKDYYELTCRVLFNERRDGNWITSNLSSAILPQFVSQSDSLFSGSRFLFSDSLFNETIIELNVKSSLVLNSKNEWANDTFKYVVTVRNISYSYYQYQRAKFLHNYNQDGDFFTGNSSATPVYSNIEGGLGIFGGYYEVKDSIIVVKP